VTKADLRTAAGRTLLVTGVNGFVGGTIARAWRKSGGQVVGVVRSDGLRRSDKGLSVVSSVYSPQEIGDLIDRCAPDAVFHGVGTASVAASFTDTDQSLNANVETLCAVLEGVRRSRYRPRVFYPSSAAVYGEPDRLPVPESASIRPLSPYGQHKAMAELRAQDYAASFDVPVAILRVFSLFGPHQRRLLVRELFEQFRDRPAVTIQGTGEETRDFLHEEDLAAMTFAVLACATERYVVLNVAAGQGTRIREVAETMRRLLGSTKDIHCANRSRPGDPLRWIADIRKLRDLLGDTAPADTYDLEGRLAVTLKVWAAEPAVAATSPVQ
jgi:UDP-glucose 4-epimerase